jgi:hypothetical protein
VLRVNARPPRVCDRKSVPVDLPVLVEEAKNGCTMGMPLCLDRKQRLIFTLGEILAATDAVGAEVLEITAENFRQCLARARRDLHSFMNNQCGLVNKSNPCRCPKKTRGFIEAGHVDSHHLLFVPEHVERVREVAGETVREIGKLTITVPKTHHDLTYTQDYTKLNAPRILQKVRGDFDLQVKVLASPLPENNTSSAGKFSFISSGLLVWQDGKNFIRLERAAEGSSAAPFVWLERFQDGKAVTQQGKPVADQDIDLRVKRSGNKLTFSVGEEGDVHTEELQVGVLAVNTTTKVFSPQLEGLKLTPK